MHDSSLGLIRQKRFLPFFLTQAFGALNDNVFKNGLIILFTYQLAAYLPVQSSVAVNLAAVLFILPFFLFSATAGQLAEKYEKSLSIQRLKLAEIAIMLFAAAGFYLQSPAFLLLVLFLMGFQSAIFGPLKYGYLPQHLGDDELIGGNGLVESGTFLAILLGTILGGLLIIDASQQYLIAIAIVVIALLGYLSSRAIPLTPAVAPDLKINWNPLTETMRNFRFMKTNRSVFLAVLGISWFWFYGAVFLAQLPEYTKTTLAGEQSVATLLLTSLSLGIGVGAFLCEKLSAGRVEVGLVPVGAFGLSLFGFDLWQANTATGLTPAFAYQAFLQQAGSWRVLVDSLFIGISGGLFTVPLYALIQQRGEKTHMSRLIAGLNILNAAFMVVSGIYAIILLQSGFSIPQLFAITALINLLVAVYIFVQAPEFIFRFITWLLINTLYRIKPEGLDKIPDQGPAVLVCNHVSFVDALIIAGYCKRNVRFVMYYKIFQAPIIGWFFKLARAIPIAGAKEDRQLMNDAFDQIAEELANGEVVCIFPEGKLTADGKIASFRKGIEKIIERTPVPVVPMALEGLWGSWFSRSNGRAMKGWPRKFMSRIELRVGDPVAPENASADRLQAKVEALFHSSAGNKPA